MLRKATQEDEGDREIMNLTGHVLAFPNIKYEIQRKCFVFKFFIFHRRIKWNLKSRPWKINFPNFLQIDCSSRKIFIKLLKA